MNNIYYVYMYLREDHTPYYIGKGKDRRAFSKNRTIKPPKDRSNICFIIENISEDEAFMWEEYWIDYFGRIDLGTGCLRNKTSGGEGASGAIRSEKFKEGRRKQMIGNTVNIGISKSSAHKKKLSEAKIGEKNPFYGKDNWNSGITSNDDPRILSGERHPYYGKNHTRCSCLCCREETSVPNLTKWHINKPCKRKLPK